jgi:glycine dehydrogenase subunit 1
MRYLPLTDQDRQDMFKAIGIANADALFKDVPEVARLKGPIAHLPNHASEFEVDRYVSALAAKNVAADACPSFLGAGAYRHHVPASVDQLLTRGEFLTSYTPYQPEVSQGTLQYLFEFQTQVAMLMRMRRCMTAQQPRRKPSLWRTVSHNITMSSCQVIYTPIIVRLSQPPPS